MTERLVVSGLRKNYGSKQALRGVDFCVSDGEVVALLGINGAGKTTTLECIEGIRNPDSGKIQLEGTLSAQLQSGSLPEYLRGTEILELFSRWNGKPCPKSIAEHLSLSSFSEKQYRQMSIGQKRRLHLALALLPDPDLLLLDEPTAGLDVEGRSTVHREIAALRDSGKAVLMATHDLAEVRTICDRLIMLRDGAVAYDGSPQEFTDGTGGLATISVRTSQGTETYAADDVGKVLMEVLTQCKEKNLPVLDVRVERGTMEEQFLRLSKGA